MRKLVGKRIVPVNAQLRWMLSLANMCVNKQPICTDITFQKPCGTCFQLVTLRLWEDTKTGEIWCEGPDNCVGCGHKLSASILPDAHFNQKEIEKLFGIA